MDRREVLKASLAGAASMGISSNLSYAEKNDAVDEAAKAGAPAADTPLGARGRPRKHFNWSDLEWIQSFAKTPIVLKGILNPDDAEHAVKGGVAAIIVSNHGAGCSTQRRQQLRCFLP